MKQPFIALTKDDVETLRRKPMSVPVSKQGVNYNFTSKQMDDAIRHLKTLYTGIVRESFASKILLLNELY
ncbi:MAG: hypothetical protein ACLSV2_11440 [Clostridium sp.]